jgi:hypothetical protein
VGAQNEADEGPSVLVKANGGALGSRGGVDALEALEPLGTPGREGPQWVKRFEGGLRIPTNALHDACCRARDQARTRMREHALASLH